MDPVPSMKILLGLTRTAADEATRGAREMIYAPSE